MNGLEYLNANKIKWFPVFMNIENGEKKLKPYPDGSMPKYNIDFDNNKLIKYRQKNYKTDAIWIDTKDIAQIDVDSQDAHEASIKLKQAFPYFNSVRKGLPHYFVTLKHKELHKARIQMSDFHDDMEILNGQASYAAYDFEVTNADKELREINQPIPEQVSVNNEKSFIKSDNIYELLDIIDIKTIDAYSSWLSIGSALFNCGYDMEVFDTFSKRSKNYGGVEKYWNVFSKQKSKNPSGFGTLCYFAKESNKLKWEDIKYKIQNETQKTAMDRFLQSGNTITHSVVARLFYEAYSDKYVYSNGCWFELTDGGIYNLLHKDAVTIISKDILEYLTEYIHNYKKTISDEDKRKALGKATTTIEGNSYKASCVEEAKQYFLDRDLFDKLNTDQTLVGFKNGVYDLKTGTFRKGTVNDKISMTTGYNYNAEISTEKQNALESLFDGYFKDPETAYYFKKHIGSLLEGGNKEEKCYFWVGSGRNGKGTTDTMLRKALGDYYQKLDNNFFTIADKHSNAPHPEIVDLENCRISMTHEPEGSTKYLTSKFKSLSGGDPLKARNLQESKFHEFKPTFKPLIQTNHLPHFTDCDFGLLQRIVVVLFEYVFVDTVNPKNKNEKQIDINLKDKLEDMNMDFFHFLTKYFKIYKSEGLREPKAVLNSINQYKKDIDSVKTYMDEAVIKTNDEKDRITTVELLELHNSFSDNKLDKGRFAKRLNANGFEVKQKKVNGSNKNCVSFIKWNNDFKEDLQNQPCFIQDDDL